MSQLSKKNKKFSKIKNKTINFDVEISNIQPINSEFSKALVKVMYANKNRNGSYFDKDMIINKMLPTLFNIPIVGHYLEDKDDFGSHDSKIEITSDGDMKFIDLTVPYGVVNESSEITWEVITEEDNSVHEYLCCTVILWTGRYPQVQRVIDEGNNQSMEVNVTEGYEDESDGLYHVTNAEFSALTILGQNVEPCFESASIGKYSLDKFKEDFSLMLKEIKNSLNPKLEENKSSDFDLNNNVKNKKEDDDMKLTKIEIAEKFSLTYEQLEDEIRRVLSTVTYVCDDYWYGEAYECRKYWLQDFDNDFVYVYNCEQDIYSKIPYSKQGDDVVIDFESASRVKTQYVDWVGVTPEGDEVVETEIDAMGEMEMSLKEAFKIKSESLIVAKETELNANFEIKLSEKDGLISEKDISIADLTEKFTKSEVEVEDLKAFKLKKETEAKESIFSEYVDELTEEEIKPVKDKIAEYSLDKVETELSLIFAKKNHKAKKNTLPKFNNMPLEPLDFKKDNDEVKEEEDVFKKAAKNLKK